MNGESHDCEVRSFDPVDSYISDPFLDPICSRLVEWLERIYIILYLLESQVLEMNYCSIAYGLVYVKVADSHCRDHFMIPSRKEPEHVYSLFS